MADHGHAKLGPRLVVDGGRVLQPDEAVVGVDLERVGLVVAAAERVDDPLNAPVRSNSLKSNVF